jgi:hypothetical protein
MSIITVDFDHTLQFNDSQPNWGTLKKLRMNHGRDQIVIITSRQFSIASVQAIDKFVKEHFLNVSNIIHTNGALKGKFCKAVGSILHFDDCKSELKDVRDHGIETVDCFDPDAWAREFRDHMGDD